MADTKRTLGEWQTKPLTNAGPTVMTMDHDRPMRDADGKTWPTVEVVCECRSMADAYLIAAAPDMLKALKSSLASADSIEEPGGYERAMVSLRLTREAIAKAETANG